MKRAMLMIRGASCERLADDATKRTSRQPAHLTSEVLLDTQADIIRLLVWYCLIQ